MKSWVHFTASVPDLAETGVKRLADRVAYLATISEDGAPRVHPVVPHIAEGSLFVYMDPASPKVQDLASDQRYALHCSVEDSNGGTVEFSSGCKLRTLQPPWVQMSIRQRSRGI